MSITNSPENRMTSETRTPAQQCRCGHFDYNHWLSGKGSCAVPECDCNGFYAAQAIDAAIEPPEAPPDLAASVEALAETVAELTRNMANGFAQIDERVTAIRNEQTELRSGINVEVNSRIKRGHLDDGRNAEIHKILVELKSRLAALESPAAEPEPIDDPVCSRPFCGHPKSEHGGGEANCYHMEMPTMSCVLKCACERFVPQASPATAHQGPPDAALVAIISDAKRRWSRDDYGTETQDEEIALSVTEYFRNKYGRDGAR